MSVVTAVLLGQGVGNQHAAALALTQLTCVKSKYRVVAVHAETAGTAASIAQVVDRIQRTAESTIRRYCEFSDDGKPSAVDSSLRTLLEDPKIEAYVMLMLPAEQPTYIKALRHSRSTNCHIFSLDLPALDSGVWSQVSEDFFAWHAVVGKDKSPQHSPTWFIFEPSRFETALNKLKLLRDSIGTVLSASIVISERPLALDPDLPNEDKQALRLYTEVLSAFRVRQSGDVDASRITAFTTVSAIIRRLVGDVQTVVTSKGSDSSATAAVFKTYPGVVVTATYCKQQTEVFEVRLCGVHGEATLKWNSSTHLFECLREVGSFDHPSYLPPTGVEWALSSFADRVRLGREEPIDVDPKSMELILSANARSSVPETWFDYATAEAILRSDGVPVKFVSVEE